MTVVYADWQTAGRGQGSNKWESEAGKNLLFSILVCPTSVDITRQFILSMAGALAIKAALDKYTDGIRLKWPNDIYWHDRKISGTLIETSVKGRTLARCIYGTGINVNQQEFHSDAPNPVSLKNITGDDYDLEQLLREVNERIERLTDFSQADEEALRQLHARYISRLYRADGKAHQWQLPTGECFEGVIVDVHPDGLLSIRHTATGEIGKYYFKEVKHVINKHVL